MKMINSSFVLQSIHNDKKILCDVRYQKSDKQKPLIVFVHGFKGFKDWGHFNLLADEFAKNGFIYLKLNLSHNGTTPERPLDFDDLEAFGNNNYTIELDDIKVLLDHLESNDFIVPQEEFDANKYS